MSADPLDDNGVRFVPCSDGQPIYLHDQRMTPGEALFAARAAEETGADLRKAVTQALVVAYIAANGPSAKEDLARELAKSDVVQRLLEDYETAAAEARSREASR